MPELHVVRGTDVRDVLDEFAEILWTHHGETVVDAATDAQMKVACALSSDQLLCLGYKAGVRAAMSETLSGNVEVEFLYGRKAEVPKENAPQASAVHACTIPARTRAAMVAAALLGPVISSWSAKHR